MKRVFWVALLFASAAHAEVLDKTAMFGPLTVQYEVVLPPNYSASRTYPGVLAFVGGGQTWDMVKREVQRTWKPEAERRGYVVVVPAAPGGQLFSETGDRVFPDFAEQLLKDFKIDGGKFHIAGHSNGGLSAFHIAAQYPQYFRSITGFPGYLTEETNGIIERIRPMCIYMHVGQRDDSWKASMRAQVERFERRGIRAHFQIEPNQEHLIETLQGSGVKRLFDQFDSCKN
jgi:dipeptidyl aminopeptidase/acylaminoacyl peptidase